MISFKAKEYLTKKYGPHDYSYEMSDYNLESLIKETKPKNFEELDKEARELEAIIADIHRRQEAMRE